jgi:hypothetical protein
MGKFGLLFLAAGIILIVIGAVLAIAGAFMFSLDQELDSEGYYLSEPYDVNSPAYAFAVWLLPLRISSFWSFMGPDIIQAKWVITADDPSKAIFAGWATSADAGSYVASMRYEGPTEWHWTVSPYYAEIDIPSTVIYNTAAPSRPPSQETFWLDSVQTNSSSVIYWNPSWPEADGMKTLIIMNADGSAGVNATFQIGSRVPLLIGLGNVLVIIGVVLCIAGAILFWLGLPILTHRK